MAVTQSASGTVLYVNVRLHLLVSTDGRVVEANNSLANRAHGRPLDNKIESRIDMNGRQCSWVDTCISFLPVWSR